MPKNLKEKIINKESKRPFGKNIFWSVIGSLIFLNIATIIFFNIRDNRQSPVVKYNLLDPARSFYDKDELISNFQPLRDYLINTYEKNPNISIYFEYDPTGDNIVINKDAQFFPASLLKLPVALAVVKKIEKGDWKWDSELVLMRSDKDENFGTLYQEPIGSHFTIEYLLEKMIADSDNTAYLMFLRNLDPTEIKDVQKNLGLEDFFVVNGKISAKKYAIFLRSLYEADYLNKDNSQKLLQIMSTKSFDNYIAAGFPNNIQFAHKIGINKKENVYLDAGIVYIPDQPYILILMINNPDEALAKQSMKDISEHIYNYVANYK